MRKINVNKSNKDRRPKVVELIVIGSTSGQNVVMNIAKTGTIPRASHRKFLLRPTRSSSKSSRRSVKITSANIPTKTAVSAANGHSGIGSEPARECA